MRVSPAPSKVVVIPGRGIAPDKLWFPWLAKQIILAMPELPVFVADMPERETAPRDAWLEHLMALGVNDGRTLLIGHSSGAVAIMRLAEQVSLWGAVLVAPHYTDCGDQIDREGGFFTQPWLWYKIQQHCPTIHVVCSDNDREVEEEPAEIAKLLTLDTSNYHILQGKGHFMGEKGNRPRELPELLPVLTCLLPQIQRVTAA